MKLEKGGDREKSKAEEGEGREIACVAFHACEAVCASVCLAERLLLRDLVRLSERLRLERGTEGRPVRKPSC